MNLRWLAAALGFLLHANEAWAGRPFDGTDAEVEDRGDLELELGPAQFVHQDDQRSLIAPRAKLTLGFAELWEGGIEVEHEVVVDEQPGTNRSRLASAELALKRVLISGSLRDGSGPSLATEAELLTPNADGDRFGADLQLAGSWKFSPATISWNVWATRTPKQEEEVTTSVIIEGPWDVAPVAEALYRYRFDDDSSAETLLVGAIWSAHSSWELDAAVRHGRADGARLTEVRVGFTGSWSLFGGDS